MNLGKIGVDWIEIEEREGERTCSRARSKDGSL